MATADRAERRIRREADETKAKAESGSGWYEAAARAGLAAKGLSYGLVGVLAATVAVGRGGAATSQTGAVATIADEPWGKLVLVLLALGFAAHAIWRLVQAVAERDDDGDRTKRVAKTWGRRAGCVGSGLVYAGLTYATIRLLTSAGGEQSQNERARETTATAFDWPGGRWIVALVGLAIVGAGIANLYLGLSTKFNDKWGGGMSSTERAWASSAGVAGHLARGVVFALVGIFVTKAAYGYDAKDAIGLDGALQKLANAAYGPWLLGVTAAGLVAFGIFCVVDARYRDVSAGS